MRTMSREEIISYIKMELSNNNDIFLDKIAKSIFNWVSTNAKYTVNYRGIGRYSNIEKINSKLNKNDYNKLEDFLEELTGEYGLNFIFLTYQDLIYEMLEDFIYETMEKCFYDLKKICPKSINEIFEVEIGIDKDDDIFFDFQSDLYGEFDKHEYINNLAELNFKEIYERGKSINNNNV